MMKMPKISVKKSESSLIEVMIKNLTGSEELNEDFSTL